MFTYESTQFNAAGFFLVLLASFISGLRWTLAQMVLQREDLGLSLLCEIRLIMADKTVSNIADVLLR